MRNGKHTYWPEVLQHPAPRPEDVYAFIWPNWAIARINELMKRGVPFAEARAAVEAHIRKPDYVKP